MWATIIVLAQYLYKESEEAILFEREEGRKHDVGPSRLGEPCPLPLGLWFT